MLQFDRLTLRRGEKLLVEDVSLLIHPGQKIGVTGANGSGKSSLFALIRGELGADSGELSLSSGLALAHVDQETPSIESAAIEFVIDGDRELRQIEGDLERARRNGDGHREAILLGSFEAVGGYTARSRAARLLSGLGFTDDDQARQLSEFSGGWRMRLNLAQALMCRSDILLLDEPTNHLDLDAVIWLESWLRAYPGTLLLISHDRDFLDATVTHIAHIEQRRIRLYAGNYSSFEVVRAQHLAQQQASFLQQQREIRRIHGFIERFRAKATKARQAQSRLKALERLETIAPAHVDSPFHFRIPAPDHTPDPLVKLEQATLGYPGRAVLSNLNLALRPGDRIGLLGPNGAGKSTLMKTLANELDLAAGELLRADGLKIGYFAQHQLEQLRADESPLQHLQRIAPGATEQSLRNFLGGFGFAGDQALVATGPFSGGEKSRLALALIVYRQPNLLLLDEPTNHLDIEMRHAVAEALQEFSGALVLVSHDRALLRSTTDELLLIHDGRVEPYNGDVDDYPAWLSSRSGRTPAGGDHALTDFAGARSRRDQRREEAEKRRLLQPLRDRVRILESALERLTSEQLGLEERLADPNLYDDRLKADLKTILGRKAEIDRAIASTEHKWFVAIEELEVRQAEN